MATGKALNGKPYAGNPHVRFDEGEVASAATPRRGSLLYVTRKALFLAAAFFTAAVVKGGEMQKTAVCASFDAATIASNGMKVADWMLAHPKRANHRDWSYGAFYAGLEEFARATGTRRYIDAIREEGRTYGWKFEKRDADVGTATWTSPPGMAGSRGKVLVCKDFCVWSCAKRDHEPGGMANRLSAIGVVGPTAGFEALPRQP